MFQIDRTIDLTQRVHTHSRPWQGHTSGEWTSLSAVDASSQFPLQSYCPTAAHCSGLDGKEVDSSDPRLSALIVFCLCPDSRLSRVSGGLEEHEALKKRGSLYLLLERIRRFSLGKKLKSVLTVQDYDDIRARSGTRLFSISSLRLLRCCFFNSL